MVGTVDIKLANTLEIMMIKDLTDSQVASGRRFKVLYHWWSLNILTGSNPVLTTKNRNMIEIWLKKKLKNGLIDGQN